MRNDISAEAITIYVDSAGGADYTSIQAAIDNATSGDTIIVANGTYYESITINKTNITLVGNSSSECKIIHHYEGNSWISDYAAAINITAPDAFINGFNISVSGNFSYGIRLNSSNSSYSRIIDNKISTSGSWSHGIYLIGSSENIIFQNNITTLIRSNGIYLRSFSINNSIDDNRITTLDYLSYGIYVDTDSWYNNLTSNNINTFAQWGLGIYLYGPSKNNLLFNNISTSGDNGYGIYMRESSDNILENNSITTDGIDGYGLYLNLNCDKNNVIGNTLKTNGSDSDGIYLRSTSDDNNILENKISTFGSNSEGIYIYDSSNIDLINNTISNIGDGFGIYFYKGKQMNLSGNNLTGGGINMYGPWLFNWDSHIIDINNTINGKPVYYYKNTQSVNVPGSVGEVIIVNCTKITVSDKSFIDGGVIEAYSDNCKIINSTFEWCSVFVTYSSNSDVTNNIFKNSSHNDFSGNSIYIGPYGSDNNVVNNKIELPSGYGIACYSDDSNILENTVVNTNGTGITVQYCSNINVENNSIQTSGQAGFGLELWSSTYNNLKNNKINIQNNRGIYLRSSSSNNYLINNEIKVNNDNTWAVGLDGASYCRLENNSIDTNGYRSYGIRLDGVARFNKIIDNQIITTGERAYGICSYNDLINVQNKLLNNTITTYGPRGYGIYLYQSAENTLKSNIINTFGSRGDGIYLQEATNNIVKKNQINTSLGGYGIFILHDSDNSLLAENIINTKAKNGHGIFSRNSDKTSVLNCIINTSGLNAYGFYLDKNNATIISTTISTSISSFDIYAINNSAITSINSSFNTVQMTEVGGGLLRVKNYLDIVVFYKDGITPIPNADAKIFDNAMRIYASPGYSGNNPATDENGTINNLLITDRWYINSNTPIENITSAYIKKTVDRTWEEERLNIDMNTSHTEIFIATDIFAPSKPTGLNAEPVLGGDALNISWDLNFENNDTKFYDLWWKGPSTGNWGHLIDISHPFNYFIWSNESLVNGTLHHFKIRARDKVLLESQFSKPVNVIHRDYLAPDPPSNVSAYTISTDSIGLNWNKSVEGDVMKYQIHMNLTGADSGGPYTYLDEVKTTSYEIINLIDDTPYYFVIKSFDEANNSSPFSIEVNATTDAILQKPKINYTIPEENNTNIPVNSSLIIAFDMPMNIITVENVLDISPTIAYQISWTNNNSIMTIEFPENLSYNTTYTIKINDAKSTIGTTLEDRPFVLIFKTEEKPKIKPTKITLTITFPESGMEFKIQENLTVNGTSTGLVRDSSIIVTLDGITKMGSIESDGNWSIRIITPKIKGNYTIKVTIGNITDSVTITMKEPKKKEEDGDKDKKEKDEDEDKSLLGMGVLIDFMIILVILIVIIMIVLLIMKKKQTRGLEKQEELEDEIEE